ncbi:MAG: endonuclease MutS2 [Bacteroidota bacterium]|nr:endonuclease MutS2 [Bacteroidota bacterium]
MPDTHPFQDAAEKLELRSITETIARSARSDLGREHVASLQPTNVFAEVADELGRVREYLSLLESTDIPPLDSLDDIRPALHRASIAGSIVSAKDFHNIARALETFRNLAAFFRKRADRVPFLAALTETLFHDKLLAYHIDRVVDEEGTVRDSASAELRAIRREIIEKTERLRRRMEAILKRVSQEDIVQEELVTLRDGRMVLPVKVEHKRQVKGFIHSTSATGQTVYIEPTETLDLNNDICDLQFAEQREISRILAELTERLRPHVQDILRSLERYAELDSLAARATYARENGCAIPAVAPQGTLTLVQARHPLLLAHKRREDVVPLDLTLGDPETTILITGPNAGGKSVAMKTVGLLALMVQSGIPVPCDPASCFPVYTAVAVDIGDEQSVENDLSTFSSHIERLARITRTADERSLVLIDEIGTGTDPAEGSALGAAILEELTRKGAHVIATTHHGMLKAFAHEHPAMRNAAMEFDARSLLPTYRFRAGLPGSSYAFEISRRHGLDPRIIDRARHFLATRSDALENLLAEVERRAQELGDRVRESEKAEREYRKAAEEYERRLEAFRREVREMRREAMVEAERLLQSANSAIENAVREIRESQARKEVVRRAHEEVDEIRRAVREGLEDLALETPISHRSEDRETPFHPGDFVVIAGEPARIGVVIQEPRGGKVAVAFGSVKMRVDIDRLEHVEPPPTSHPMPTLSPTNNTRNEIDIRGMYGDEAVASLDTYLAEAYAAGYRRVDIIHGKGTGTLRKRVQEFLRTIPFVESFRLGEWNEGSSGVTVVFFKE